MLVKASINFNKKKKILVEAVLFFLFKDKTFFSNWWITNSTETHDAKVQIDFCSHRFTCSVSSPLSTHSDTEKLLIWLMFSKNQRNWKSRLICSHRFNLSVAIWCVPDSSYHYQQHAINLVNAIISDTQSNAAMMHRYKVWGSQIELIIQSNICERQLAPIAQWYSLCKTLNNCLLSLKSLRKENVQNFKFGQMLMKWWTH